MTPHVADEDILRRLSILIEKITCGGDTPDEQAVELGRLLCRLNDLEDRELLCALEIAVDKRLSEGRTTVAL